MRGSQVFPSKYLKAADLEDLDDASRSVTIEEVRFEIVFDKRQPVCYFVGRKKPLVLNVTNWRAITALAGSDDSDNWPQTRLKLVAVPVEFQGKRTMGVRIEAPNEVPRPTKREAPKRPAGADEGDRMTWEAEPDDIPF